MSIICNLGHIKALAAQLAYHLADFPHLVRISYGIGGVKSNKIHAGIHKQYHMLSYYILVVRAVIAV